MTNWPGEFSIAQQWDYVDFRLRPVQNRNRNLLGDIQRTILFARNFVPLTGIGNHQPGRLSNKSFEINFRL
jgi:hypothetical protein